ncbi:MAG: cytochrome c oxidase subunit 3 [Bacteroidia bacterium]|nr:cytochrome c oxidase subunit 3 [Bacteroidia bacterium]
MLFAGLTSAYMVRQGEGKWVKFDLPGLFMVSTAMIIFSSVTLQWALVSVKKNNLPKMNLALGLTAILGLGFVLFQYLAWKQLVAGGIYFVGTVKDINMHYEYVRAGTENPSDVQNVAGSFLYALTGLHVTHLVGGLIALSVVLWRAILKKYNANSYEGISVCAIYWHFLDGLWIYLYLFLIFIR